MFVSLGGQRYPEGLPLPRSKRACGVPAELPLGQMHQAPHASAGLHVVCGQPEGTSCTSRERSILTRPSLCSTRRRWRLSSYWMTPPLIRLRLSLHQKLSWPGARSDPWRTGVHAHLLQRSGLQKKRKRVRLLMKPFYPEGCQRKDILPKRYEIFTSDHDWVQSVRGSLLGLEAGTTPSRRDIDNSSRFIPRAAASKSDLPEVITNHWLPILRREGLLVECPPDQFTAPADWVPLYTCEGLQKYLPAALPSFPSQGAPSLTAVVPPEFHVGTDKEFLLSNFHRHQCLVRQSFNLEGRRRQLAFCPYCGVINENSDTAFSHVRKHLDLQFVCGGCCSKSFLNGPTLNKHMKTQCPSVTAIRDRSKSSRR